MLLGHSYNNLWDRWLLTWYQTKLTKRSCIQIPHLVKWITTQSRLWTRSNMVDSQFWEKKRKRNNSQMDSPSKYQWDLEGLCLSCSQVIIHNLFMPTMTWWRCKNTDITVIHHREVNKIILNPLKLKYNATNISQWIKFANWPSRSWNPLSITYESYIITAISKLSMIVRKHMAASIKAPNGYPP